MNVLSEQDRAKLRHVRASESSISLERFPDFLIVGPQRTGTTWLHANLREHPEVFLAEPKELFYFSRLQTPEHPRFQSTELSWYLGFFRDPLWRWTLKQALCLARHRRPYRPRIRGEATASYAALDPEVIADIALLNPQLKVIVMIRNPVERAWSHAMKDLVRNAGRRFEDVGEDEFAAFFADPYQLRCAHFVENIGNWKKAFGDQQVFVGLFDDIARRPADFMMDVLRFLGVSSERRYIGSQVEEAVNPATSAEIPPRLRARLEQLLGGDIERLAEVYDLRWPQGGNR